MTFLAAFFGVAVIVALFVVTSSVKIVGQAEVMVIERLGRFHRLARSGFNILIPFIERPKSIGRVRSFFGNFGILVRAYTYILSLGGDGLENHVMGDLGGRDNLKMRSRTIKTG